LFQNIYSKEEF